MIEPTREELREWIRTEQRFPQEYDYEINRVYQDAILRLALEALDRRAQTTAWVIERDINGRLFYWNGRPSGDQQWSLNHEFAMRFTREPDAKAMLVWHCGDEGRVVEHMWIRTAHQPKDEGK